MESFCDAVVKIKKLIIYEKKFIHTGGEFLLIDPGFGFS